LRRSIPVPQQSQHPRSQLRAMDEGHGFAKKANRDYFQAATVMFFRKHFEAGP
jgi:hypothetical protein